MMMMQFEGQPHVSRFLHRAFRSGRLSHAFAFVGPAGIGKRDAARRFAAALFAPHEAGWDRDYDEAAYAEFAERGGTAAEGPVTQRVLAGHHPDVHLYAPEEGKRFFVTDLVDQLQDELTLAPSEAPVRVAILDAADTMTEAAANKFLKTLEEPPRCTQLVLLADEWSGLLETVRSRVQAVRFRPLPSATLRESYERYRIAAQDQAGAPDAAAAAALDEATFAALAPHAQGSPGILHELVREEFAAVREYLYKHVVEKPPVQPVDAAEGLQSLVERKSDATQEPQRQRLLHALGQTLIWWRDALVAGRLGAAEPLDAATFESARRRLVEASVPVMLERIDAQLDLVGDLLGNLNLKLWTLRMMDLAPMRV